MDSTTLDVLGQLFGYISPRVMPANNTNNILSYTNFYEPKLSNLEYANKLYKNGFIPSVENREGPALTEMWKCVIIDRLFPPNPPAPQRISNPDEFGNVLMRDHTGKEWVEHLNIGIQNYIWGPELEFKKEGITDKCKIMGRELIRIKK
jgi:hypothetical protein